MKIFLSLLLILSTSAISLSGCTKNSVSDDEIRIGVVGSLTGSEATYGISTRDGVALAAEQLNAKGGIKGKKIKFNYRLMVHDLVEYNDELLMIGEAFYPHYVYPRFYNPQARTERIFDGYKYTHAVVIGFRKDRQLAWDNSFEINDVKTYQLQQFVRVQAEEKRILLMYLFDNVIRSKIILNDEVLEGKTGSKILSGGGDEELDRDEENTEKLDAWYGKYFYASGTQSLKGRRGTYRQVFFINKITYR